MNFILAYNMTKNTGGASYNPVTGKYNPSTGYMVAREGGLVEPYSPDADSTTFSKHLNTFLDKDGIIQSLIDGDDTYIGFWLHNDSLHIDLVDNINDFDSAYNTGFERNQISIWDCAKEREIEIIHSPLH